MNTPEKSKALTYFVFRHGSGDASYMHMVELVIIEGQFRRQAAEAITRSPNAGIKGRHTNSHIPTSHGLHRNW